MGKRYLQLLLREQKSKTQKVGLEDCRGKSEWIKPETELQKGIARFSQQESCRPELLAGLGSEE